MRNKLYAEGKYDDAAAAYNAALVDHPDSADLHFNLGDATYKQGKYEDAGAAFQKVETAGDPKRASRVAYNVGNATYRQGQALEQTEPQKPSGSTPRRSRRIAARSASLPTTRTASSITSS